MSLTYILLDDCSNGQSPLILFAIHLSGISVADGSYSGGKRLFAAALAVYVALFAVFVAVYILLKDGDTLITGMSAVAFVFLLVSAVLAYHVFFRVPKDRAPEDVFEESWEKGKR